MLVVINFHFWWAIWAGWYRPQGAGGKENSRQDLGNVRVVNPPLSMGINAIKILASDSVIKQTHFFFPLKSIGLISVASEQVKDVAYLFPSYQKCSRFLLHFCNLHRTHPGYPSHSRKSPFQFSPDGLHRTLERYVWYFLQVGNGRQTASSITFHTITVSHVRSRTAPTQRLPRQLDVVTEPLWIVRELQALLFWTGDSLCCHKHWLCILDIIRSLEQQNYP